jgi:3'-phosphoadenosine 5'-phosphosulfate sulfotransferase (PAPS reductase)/FAD synthetase
MLPANIQALADRGAMFVINHSGGKDSQAMTLFLQRHIPREQLVIIHADLPGVDWEGIAEHIRETAPGIPFYISRNENKTFLEMVERRGKFPSPQQRQCTSDLKRDPINRTIRRLGYRLIVSCQGMRAEESTPRAKLATFRLDARNSTDRREQYVWLPIHAWTERQVYAAIAEAGQQPHWAYGAGMSRLSCCFCIMASKADLQTAARLKPELFRRYCELERRIGQTMMMPLESGRRRFLDEIVGGAMG